MPERTWRGPARYGHGQYGQAHGQYGQAQGRYVQGQGRGAARVHRGGASAAWRLLAGPPPVTGRGAVLGLFLLSFLGLLVSDWLAAGTAGGVTFTIACVAAAWRTRRRDLLAVAVSPPLVFLAACVCAQWAVSAGSASAAEGTLMDLAGSAPWLFAGTALTVIITLCRGLASSIREHRVALRGDPAGSQDGPGRSGQSRSAQSGHRPG